LGISRSPPALEFAGGTLRPAKTTQPIFARDWSCLQSLAFLDEPCHGNKNNSRPAT
jgi:hypothetical protein